jgi:hypothetical protein
MAQNFVEQDLEAFPKVIPIVAAVRLVGQPADGAPLFLIRMPCL